MKILIDINHPAHVHYFRNFFKIMKSKNHSLIVTSRNKEIAFKLLEHYEIPFISRGDGSNSFLGKFFYLLNADLKLYKIGRKFKPDLLLSFLHPYPAHVAKLLGVPHITFSDTEHANLHHKLTVPYTTLILTPSVYTKNLGEKQVKFDGYMELCYLHPNYFTPNSEIFRYLNISSNEKFAILRFVSWTAIHDFGYKGFSMEQKISIVNEIKKYCRVFISCEGEFPEELKQYRIKIPPHLMHDALNYATLYVGEGATMASEAAILGTPAIYINPLVLSYCEEEEKKYNLLSHFPQFEGIIEKINSLLTDENLKETFKLRQAKLLNDKIDVTSFMVWFIENYPNSYEELKRNPDYQLKFKGPIGY